MNDQQTTLELYNYVVDIDTNREYEIKLVLFDIPIGSEKVFEKLDLCNILCLPDNYDYDDEPIFNYNVVNRFESAYMLLKVKSFDELIPDDVETTQVDILMFIEDVLNYLIMIHNSINNVCRLRINK